MAIVLHAPPVAIFLPIAVPAPGFLVWIHW